jgi:hypothetical protein
MPDILVHIRESYERGPVLVLIARQSGSISNKVLCDSVAFSARANLDRDSFTLVRTSILRLIPSGLMYRGNSYVHSPDIWLSVFQKDRFPRSSWPRSGLFRSLRARLSSSVISSDGNIGNVTLLDSKCRSSLIPYFRDWFWERLWDRLRAKLGNGLRFRHSDRLRDTLGNRVWERRWDGPFYNST